MIRFAKAQGLCDCLEVGLFPGMDLVLELDSIFMTTFFLSLSLLFSLPLPWWLLAPRHTRSTSNLQPVGVEAGSDPTLRSHGKQAEI